MTDHGKSRRLAHLPPPLAALLAVAGLAGCDSIVGNGADSVIPDGGAATADAGASAPPKGNGDGGSTVVANPPGKDDDDATPLPACGQATQRAQTALQTYCAGCHGADSDGKGNFKAVLDADKLIASGKVVPKKPAESPLFKRLSSGAMPPKEVAKRPGDADKKAVEDWIACGAPDFDAPGAAAYKFVDINTRLDAVLDDVRSVSSTTARKSLRYIDLSTLSNAGFSKDQVEVYRQAVSFMMNSLSRGAAVVAPEPVDGDQLIYRVDLGDYEWTAATWTQLEQVYPYAVVYDQDSRLFPFDEDTAAQIRRETGTQIPIIQGDWLLSHASRPPLYHTLLNLPDNLPALERQLGIDIQDDIDNEEVVRSGFKVSGPSQNHRVIERHDLPGNRGAFWISYDFANNLGTRNIFANPLTFTPDGGEVIFNLDNGLQAYLLVTAAGARLDKAPSNIVQDPLSRDGAVENGLSCMTCHQENGQLPKTDELRDFVLSTGASAREIEDVLSLYPEKEEMAQSFEDDAQVYRDARAKLNITKVGSITLHELDDTHLGIMDLNAVAAVIGIEPATLERALGASPTSFPPEIVALRTTGGGIQRDAFDSVVKDLVEALGLGRQLRVSRNGQTSQSSSTGSSSRTGSGTSAADAGTRTR